MRRAAVYRQVRGSHSRRLPVLVAQSVVDESLVSLKSLERRVAGRELLAGEWQSLIDGGEVRDRADLARRMGVSRARITQVLGARDGVAGRPDALHTT
jgi:hypothetical protein